MLFGMTSQCFTGDIFHTKEGQIEIAPNADMIKSVFQELLNKIKSNNMEIKSHENRISK